MPSGRHGRLCEVVIRNTHMARDDPWVIGDNDSLNGAFVITPQCLRLVTYI